MVAAVADVKMVAGGYVLLPCRRFTCERHYTWLPRWTAHYTHLAVGLPTPPTRLRYWRFWFSGRLVPRTSGELPPVCVPTCLAAATVQLN